MNNILLFFINILYVTGFSKNLQSLDYKIPKWVKHHFNDNKLTPKNLEVLNNKNNTLSYEIPKWVHKDVFEYNKKLGDS